MEATPLSPGYPDNGKVGRRGHNEIVRESCVMKIGFDVSQTGNGKAGCGYFADSLIQTLVKVDCQDEYILYPHFGTSFWDPTARRSTRMIYQPNVSKKVIGRNLTEAMEFWQGIPPDMEDQLGSPNIVHANNYSCPVGFQKARLVYTLYDLNFLEHPEWTTEQNRCVCFEGVFKASVYADFIVAISRYSHDKFLEFFPHYPAERIKVVSLGSRFPGKQDVVSRGKIFTKLRSGEFWLAVGTLEPRKNSPQASQGIRLPQSQDHHSISIGARRRKRLAGG